MPTLVALVGVLITIIVTTPDPQISRGVYLLAYMVAGFCAGMAAHLAKREKSQRRKG